MASDIRDELRNAISILGAPGAAAEHVASRNMETAVNMLRSAQQAIADLDGELNLLTSPELDAIKEARKLREELEAATARNIELEQKIDAVQHKAEVERHVQAEERKRLADLEKKSKTFDKVLMEDEDAFGKFMDQAMDEHDRKHGKQGYDRQ